MELEKIIRKMWEPLVKKYSKEYVLNQIIQGDKKELVMKILNGTGKGMRVNYAKEEYIGSI
jgi:hypothetical protein